MFQPPPSFVNSLFGASTRHGCELHTHPLGGRGAARAAAQRGTLGAKACARNIPPPARFKALQGFSTRPFPVPPHRNPPKPMATHHNPPQPTTTPSHTPCGAAPRARRHGLCTRKSSLFNAFQGFSIHPPPSPTSPPHITTTPHAPTAIPQRMRLAAPVPPHWHTPTTHTHPHLLVCVCVCQTLAQYTTARTHTHNPHNLPPTHSHLPRPAPTHVCIHTIHTTPSSPLSHLPLCAHTSPTYTTPPPPPH